jgi:hypothetical protein
MKRNNIVNANTLVQQKYIVYEEEENKNNMLVVRLFLGKLKYYYDNCDKLKVLDILQKEHMGRIRQSFAFHPAQEAR